LTATEDAMRQRGRWQDTDDLVKTSEVVSFASREELW
jgi:hypothetical protein